MLSPTPQQLKRLEKLAKVMDGGNIAIVQQIAEVEERLDEVASQIPALRQAVDGVDGDKGEKGDTGAPGANGINGKDGKDGRDGIDGKDGKNGIDGLVGAQGERGKDGVDGKDGKDGFIDEATIGYLEEEIKKLDKKHGGYGQVVRKLRAGTNITIDDSNMEYPVINATGGGADWTYYATTWSVEPTLNTSITGGDVYNYTLDGTTRYRFVPTVYDATEDAFYSTFVDPTLSGLIITRG